MVASCGLEADCELPLTSEVASQFTESSIGLHEGRRGCTCKDERLKAKCPEGVEDAGPFRRLVGKSSDHGSMIELVSALYQERSSSFLPQDIRRDKAEVETACGNDKASGYGEIQLGDFIDMLNNAGAHAGQQFWDLGSGLGKLVLTAGLLGMDATGVEIVNQRYQQACEAIQQAEVQGIGDDHGSIKFLHGSFYDIDFSDADILFINSVLFSDEMMKVIAQKARSLKHGARIISYLGLPDAGDKSSIGTWFKRGKSVTLKATWVSGAPFKTYMVVDNDRGKEKARQTLPGANDIQTNLGAR